MYTCVCMCEESQFHTPGKLNRGREQMIEVRSRVNEDDKEW